MPNTIYDTKLIAGTATELLASMINHRTLMTIDTSLQGSEGMVKTINTYTYSGEVEEVEEGKGNTARGSVSYVGKDYRVAVIQQVFDYTDEDYMKDNKIVDMGVKGATQVMDNYLTTKFYAALNTKNATEEFLVPTIHLGLNAALSYDAVVDAIAEMNIEDESQLVLLIPNTWKADIRKDEDYKGAQLGEIIYNGQVGTIAGIPVVATKALAGEAFLLTPEAVTLFLKKDVEGANDRNENTRTNSIFLRQAYICALTDATKAIRLTKTAAPVVPED